MTFEELKELLLKYNSFVITTHVNPDADALGSEIAMYYILQQYNKNVRIINYSKIPENLVFMGEGINIEKYDSEIHNTIIKNVDVVIFVDLNSISRTKGMENAIRESNCVKICIDHHEYPENFTNNMYVNPKSCSTGEIIYNFINETKICSVDLNIANVLYAAIMTDTGSFRYDRTTSHTHRIIAEFLDLGVVPYKLHDLIYDNSSFGKTKLLGEVLSNLQINDSKNVCYMVITSEMLNRLNVEESEVDGFVNYNLSIKGILVGILFLELADGFKVSIRSKGVIPVNLLAKEYGGGGHINASGIRFINQKMNDFIEEIVYKAENYIKKYME